MSAADSLLELAGDLCLDRDPSLDRDRDRALGRNLSRDRDFARALVRIGRRQRGAGWVAPSASRLLAAATRLLPVADRARYAEEYRSELWEIAHAGQPRRSQIRYAARQAASSLRLRAELRAARRRKASP